MTRLLLAVLIVTLACLFSGCATSSDDAKKDDEARAPQASSAPESAQQSEERPSDSASSSDRDSHDDSTSDRSSEDTAQRSGDSEANENSDDPTRAKSGEDKRRKRMAKKVKNKTIVESIGAGESGNAKSIEEAFANTESGESSSSDANDTEGIGSIEEDEASANKDGCTGQKCPEADRVTVTVGDIDISGKGSLRKESINAVARRKLSHIQRCLERAVISNDDFPRQGELTAEITIGRRGRVVASNIEKVGDDGASDCAQRASKRWRFPRPKGGEATAEIDFSFESNGKD